jgi:hypothetical protein
MWEIIADPKEYGIDRIEAGLGNNKIAFPDEDRKRWAEEIHTFTQKVQGLADRSRKLKELLASDAEIMATPASLKTLKVVMFKINDALNTALEMADNLEEEFVKK